MLKAAGCQFSHEKEKALEAQNAAAHDSTRHAVNPYKTGQDTKLYDQQREVVGNIDTLVTPQDPGIPSQ